MVNRNDKFFQPVDAVVFVKKANAPFSDLTANAAMSEDDVKRAIEAWLKAAGWRVQVMMGKAHGIDIEAHKGDVQWVIEAKGCGSRAPMRVNYFLAMLGELLQRMTNKNARYSIALPNLPQFRGLWERLPPLAKERTGITALFVDANGQVSEVN